MNPVVPAIEQILPSDIDYQKIVRERKGQALPAFSGRKEVTRWLAENIQNKKSAGGRINFDGSDVPGGPAHTVSPFVGHFLENIEDRLKKPIGLLVERGYLPFSSCHGHGFTDSAYFTLAFGSVEQREKFHRFLRKRHPLLAFFRLLRFTHRRKMLNSPATFHANNSFRSIQKSEVDVTDQEETEYYNAIFYRNHLSWNLLQVNVGWGWGFRNIILRFLVSTIQRLPKHLE